MQPALEIVSGKGGVGKSAVSAATAIRRAHLGERVLVLASNDPRGLGAHLGRQTLPPEPVEVRDGLHAAHIAPGHALQQYLRLNMKVPTPRMSLATRAFNVLATAAPGIREIVTIGRIAFEADRGEWDAVIVDAPATGQLDSYLTAPETVSSLVPTGRVLEQSSWMSEVLGAASTRLTLVSLPEELPVAETHEAAQRTGHICGETRIVANRVLDRLPVTAGTLAALDDGPARAAAQLHQSLFDEQQLWRDQLDAEIDLPYVFGVLTPHEVASRLAEEIT